MCAQASRVHVHVCAHLCVYFGVCMDACMLMVAHHQQCLTVTAVNHSRPHARSVQVTLLNTTTTPQQQQHTATTTSRRVSNERGGVRVGAASMTDEPEKTPATQYD